MARPRREDSIDVKAEALKAAIRLLHEDPGSLSLGAIARRVGCSAPALYAHFTGKDDLLEQARLAAHAEMIAAKRARFAGFQGDPLDRLRAGGRDYVAYAQANPALYRLIFAPSHGTGAGGASLTEAALAPLAAGVRAAQAAGFARGVEAGALAEAMWFAVHGAILMALDRQLPGPDAERWQRAMQAVDTVMALLAPGTGKD